jgi:hypothetical protein
MIVKNNLNVGSMSSNRKQHFPLLKSIKRIPDFNLFRKLVDKLMFSDRFYPIRNTIVLAPGDFNGFYEFDRESFVLPLYCGNYTEQLCHGMVSYRLMIESSLDGSEFMKDADELFGAGKIRVKFKELYLKCFLNSDEAFDKLSEDEKSFVYKHLIVNHHQFFLNNTQFIISDENLAKNIKWIETDGKDAPGCIHQVAGQYFKQGKTEIAQKMLQKSCQLEKNQRYLLSLVAVYDKLGKSEAADKIVEKCLEMPLYFPAKLYIWQRNRNK